eukprot:RCo040727
MGLWGWAKAPFSWLGGSSAPSSPVMGAPTVPAPVGSPSAAPSPPQPQQEQPPDAPATAVVAKPVAAPPTPEETEAREYCFATLAKRYDMPPEVAPLLCGTLRTMRHSLSTIQCMKDMRMTDAGAQNSPMASALLCRNVSGPEAYYARRKCQRLACGSKIPTSYTDAAVLCQHIYRDKHVTPILTCYRRCVAEDSSHFTVRAAVTACRFVKEEERDQAIRMHRAKVDQEVSELRKEMSAAGASTA